MHTCSVSIGDQMGYLKHSNNGKGESKRTAKKAEVKKRETAHVVVTGPDAPRYTSTPALQHEINHISGIGGIEQALDGIGESLGNLGLSIVQGPIKLTLAENDEYDAGRLFTALERIADSVALLAGLSRPRLEQWHDQETYVPRFREGVFADRAPGPSAKVTEFLQKCGSEPDNYGMYLHSSE